MFKDAVFSSLKTILQSVPCKHIRNMLLFYLMFYIYFSSHHNILSFLSYFYTSSFLSQLSFYFSFFCVSVNFLWAFLRLFLSPPPPFFPPTALDSNIKQVGKNGQAIMIYDQCMQQLLTFIMTVAGGGRAEER